MNSKPDQIPLKQASDRAVLLWHIEQALLLANAVLTTPAGVGAEPAKPDSRDENFLQYWIGELQAEVKAAKERHKELENKLALLTPQLETVLGDACDAGKRARLAESEAKTLKEKLANTAGERTIISDGIDNEWLNAIGQQSVRVLGYPWETRDGETREEGLKANVSALFQIIEDMRSFILKMPLVIPPDDAQYAAIMADIQRLCDPKAKSQS